MLFGIEFTEGIGIYIGNSAVDAEKSVKKFCSSSSGYLCIQEENAEDGTSICIVDKKWEDRAKEYNIKLTELNSIEIGTKNDKVCSIGISDKEFAGNIILQGERINAPDAYEKYKGIFTHKAFCEELNSWVDCESIVDKCKHACSIGCNSTCVSNSSEEQYLHFDKDKIKVYLSDNNDTKEYIAIYSLE